MQEPKKSTSSVSIIILSLFQEESYNAIVSQATEKNGAHHSRIPAAFCKKRLGVVKSELKKWRITAEYPQHFVQKNRGCHNR
jgi:hypothetical protein